LVSFQGPDLLSFGHDRCGNLITVMAPGGAVEYRNADEVGNVYATHDGSDRKYGPGGRLLVADGCAMNTTPRGSSSRASSRAGRGGAPPVRAGPGDLEKAAESARTHHV
jgi:hypothetical protein